jgi:cold shock CspA family protein
MKYLGLIKWFDIRKGFGKIGTPENGDIFIHQNNLLDRLEKLSVATSLIFEIKKDDRGTSAIKAQTPTSYEDFQLILSYLKKNPSISAELLFTSENRWGNTYTYKEHRSFSIVEYSLYQLLQKKKATEIFEFFKNYFDEQYLEKGSEFVIKYFDITKEKIQEIKLELNRLVAVM